MWDSLAKTGVRFQRGQLALVAAAPGIGKSAFVLNYALRSGVSCLYFSADSDAFVQLSRSLAILGDVSMEEAGTMVLNGNREAINRIVGESPVRFSYNPSPTLSHIENQVKAYDELYGDYPELIVVDNALDVELVDPVEDQSQSLDGLMAWLHDLARTTEACVVVLHHVTGPFNNGSAPIPLNGVKGQIGRVPELILTLHKDSGDYVGDETLNVSAVKNRGQKADPSGESFTELAFVSDRMTINDKVTANGDLDIWATHG